MNIKQLKADIADLPDDMEIIVSLTEEALKALPDTECPGWFPGWSVTALKHRALTHGPGNPLYSVPTHTTLKSLLLSPMPLTEGLMWMAMNATPGALSTKNIYDSLLTLHHTINQTVEVITAPHTKRIAEYEKQLWVHRRQYRYLKSNPWWKRMWLALKNDYAENNG